MGTTAPPVERTIAESNGSRPVPDFDAIYRAYREPLIGYCRGRVANWEDAEDVFQNTMIRLARAFERGGAFENGGEPIHVRRWLYKVAHGEAIKLRTRRPTRALPGLRRIKEPDSDSEIDDLLEVPDHRQTNFEARARLTELLRLFPNLAPRYRRALALRAFAGKTYKEIAADLDVEPMSVGHTMTRARDALRKAESESTAPASPAPLVTSKRAKPEKLLDARALAKRFGCGVAWIEGRTAEGMPCVHLFGEPHYRLSDVQLWMEAVGRAG